MRYTWPKMKLCRREKKNLFWTDKYDLKKWAAAPGQHGTGMQRLSEYWTLLRNKQSLKRMYGLSEKQFVRIVTDVAKKYAKNKWVSHDKAVLEFLERRCDSVLLKSGFAKTIMQARQMMSHGHWLLNGKKHNIPSSFLKVWDVLELRKRLQVSGLYESTGWRQDVAVWVKTDKNKYTVELVHLPDLDASWLEADVLKVIEFYARA